MSTLNPKHNAESVLATIEALLQSAVAESPAALVRTYWESFNLLRAALVSWERISVGLRANDMTFTADQLKAAFRYERKRRSRMTTAVAQPSLPISQFRGTARLLSQSVDVRQERDTSMDDAVADTFDSHEGPLLEAIAIDDRPHAEDEIKENLVVRDGMVFWKKGLPLDRALPPRVLLLLKRNGRYVAPNVGRTSNHMVKMEN